MPGPLTCPVRDNRALSQASEQARKSEIPLVVLFILSPQDYVAHDRGARRIDFVLRNLRSLKVSPLLCPTQIQRCLDRIIGIKHPFTCDHPHSPQDTPCSTR